MSALQRILLLAALTLTACAGALDPGLPNPQGANPLLPAPQVALIPTVNIARAVGWAADSQPRAAAGLQVQALARGLTHPRWLLVLPNGDLLVAESNAPARPDDAPGIRGWIMKKVMSLAGAGVPSPDRITLLRDADGDGVAETRSVFIDGLHSPFGMALVGGYLYVANTDAVMRFAYLPGATRLAGPGEWVADLPAGPINHHWTKNLLASADGKRLYATVGSNSNVGENGLAAETGRAAIVEIDLASGAVRPYASGLRNPNGLAWEPASGRLWTVVNERDELGDNLVPDYLTAVQDGGFYGWPYSWFGSHVDTRVQPQRPDLVARAIVPDHALGAHVAALGLAFSSAKAWPAPFAQGGAFIGEHGSWNRQPRSGYEVVFVPFAQGRPTGHSQPVLSGFLNADGQAQGRPVGVAFDASGALLVADDVGNAVWRVRPLAGAQRGPVSAPKP